MEDGNLLVICRRLEVGVKPDHLGDERVTLLLDLLPRAILARVQPLALAVVDGLRGGGPENGRQKRAKNIIDTFP